MPRLRFGGISPLPPDPSVTPCDFGMTPSRNVTLSKTKSLNAVRKDKDRLLRNLSQSSYLHRLAFHPLQNPSQSHFTKGEMTIMLSFSRDYEKKYYCVFSKLLLYIKTMTIRPIRKSGIKGDLLRYACKISRQYSIYCKKM